MTPAVGVIFTLYCILAASATNTVLSSVILEIVYFPAEGVNDLVTPFESLTVTTIFEVWYPSVGVILNEIEPPCSLT